MRVKRVKILNYDIIGKIVDLRSKKVSYVDAIIEISDTNNIDMDDLVEMLPDDMIEEIKIEFYKRKMTKEDEKLKDKVDIKEKIENIMHWLD